MKVKRKKKEKVSLSILVEKSQTLDKILNEREKRKIKEVRFHCRPNACALNKALPLFYPSLLLFIIIVLLFLKLVVLIISSGPHRSAFQDLMIRQTPKSANVDRLISTSRRASGEWGYRCDDFGVGHFYWAPRALWATGFLGPTLQAHHPP